MPNINFFEGTRAEPRPYQERICQKTIDMLMGDWVSKGGDKPGAARSVLIDAPTGSGKTVIALAVAQYAALHLGKRFGWVSMRRNLLRQARDMTKSFGFQIPNIRFISMFDNNPPTDIDWLIEDEAQHDSTFSMAHILNAIKPEKVIGLSATPFRSDRAQLPFERIIKDIGIHSLIQDGYLSQFDHYTIPSFSPGSVAELFETHRDKWGKSIIFFRTMVECEEMLRLLRKIEVKSDIVWRNSDREDQIDKFRAGDLEVLVSMTILTEGFDLEELQSVFIRPSSKLPTTQMAGRVLRKWPAFAAKQIIQCQDTRYPFVRMASPRMSYTKFGDGFRSLSQNENVEKVARHYATRILKSEPEIPAFIGRGKKTLRFARPRRNRR